MAGLKGVQGAYASLGQASAGQADGGLADRPLLGGEIDDLVARVLGYEQRLRLMAERIAGPRPEEAKEGAHPVQRSYIAQLARLRAVLDDIDVRLEELEKHV